MKTKIVCFVGSVFCALVRPRTKTLNYFFEGFEISDTSKGKTFLSSFGMQAENKPMLPRLNLDAIFTGGTRTVFAIKKRNDIHPYSHGQQFADGKTIWPDDSTEYACESGSGD
jgi:hypothetical protein